MKVLNIILIWLIVNTWISIIKWMISTLIFWVSWWWGEFIEWLFLSYQSGNPEPKQCSDIKWIKPNEISKFAFPKANHKFMDYIPMNNPWL